MACKLQLSVVSPTLPRTGKDYVDAWMREKCHLIRMAEDQDVNTLLPEFMRYIEQFWGIAGSKCPVRMIFLWDIGLRRIVNVSPALGFNLTLEDPQPKPEITVSFFEACRYIVCLVDFTSMPANAKQVQSSMNVFFEYCPWDGFDQHRTCADAFVPQANKGEYSHEPSTQHRGDDVERRPFS